MNNIPLYTNEQIDHIVDNHIFLDNGTATYRIWEDRANRYLREMRDRYERELYFWQQYAVTKNLELLEARQIVEVRGINAKSERREIIDQIRIALVK